MELPAGDEFSGRDRRDERRPLSPLFMPLRAPHDPRHPGDGGGKRRATRAFVRRLSDRVLITAISRISESAIYRDLSRLKPRAVVRDLGREVGREVRAR